MPAIAASWRSVLTIEPGATSRYGTLFAASTTWRATAVPFWRSDAPRERLFAVSSIASVPSAPTSKTKTATIISTIVKPRSWFSLRIRFTSGRRRRDA